MADCKINPSFLRSFDFKLLYGSPGVDEYRAMDYNPLTGEVICFPFGNNHLLQSKDWGYTFTKKEGTLDILQTQNVVLDAKFGLGRYGMFATNSKLGGTAPLSTATNRSGTALLVVESNSLIAAEGYFQTASYGYPAGVFYANGCFSFSVFNIGASSSPVYATRWYGGLFTAYTQASPSTGRRFGLVRGTLVYATANPGLTATAGAVTGVYAQAFPITASNLPTHILKGNFVDATTFVEISDMQDYSAIVADGAVAIERDGHMWRATAAEMTTWAKGGDLEVGLTGISFPHIAAGYGQFNDPVLLSLDPSGSKGIFSTDHGATLQSFDLPQELGQTLPGGIFVNKGELNASIPRCYTIKYIPDPETNFTKGRWILCGGLAVWEMIPVYGA